MKKLLLTLSFIIGLYSISSAQNIGIVDSETGQSRINDTIEFVHYIDTNGFVLDLSHTNFVKIVNNSASTMTIRLKRIEKQIIPGTRDYLCWGVTCFGSFAAGDSVEWDVDDEAVVQPQDTAGGTGLIVYLVPNNQSGEAIYEYQFYDKANPNDTASVFVKWKVYYKEDNFFVNDLGDNDLQYDTLRLYDTLFADNSHPSVFSRLNLAKLVNNSPFEKTIDLTRTEIQTISGTQDSICWDNQCLSLLGAGNSSDRTINSAATLSSGSSSQGAGLSFYLKHNDQEGVAIYEFKFTDSVAESNSKSFFVKWHIYKAPPPGTDIGIVDAETGMSRLNDTIDFVHYVDTSGFIPDLSHSNFVKIVNNTAATMTIRLKRIERQIISGTRDYLCWGATCFGSFAAGDTVSWDVDDEAIVDPQDTAGGTGLIVYLIPNKESGTAIYEYEFYNKENPNVTASVFVRWTVYYAEDNFFVNGSSNNDLQNDTLELYDTLYSDNRFEAIFNELDFASLVNNSPFAKTINVTRKEIETINGTQDSLCWDTQCLPFVNAGNSSERSINSIARLTPGSSSPGSGLSFYLKHNNTPGEALYEFTFTDSAEASNSKSVFVKWSIAYATSLSSNEVGTDDFNVFPNPTSGMVSLMFNGDMRKSVNKEVIIRNLVGKTVRRINVEQQTESFNIDLSDLDKSLYFVSYVVEGDVIATKKLIVQ